jgi:SAM-dependent methyltransferase
VRHRRTERNDNRDPARLTGIDASEGFIAFARHKIREPRAAFEIGDARALPVADGSVETTVSGLVLNFVPDQPTAMQEMRRVTQPRGTVAVYVWGYAGGMQMMRYFWDAAVALDPAALRLDEGRRFPVCEPGQLVRLFRDAGLENVEVRAIDMPTVFKDFKDYWSPFLGGQGPAPGYCMSLPEVQRTALRERLRGALPTRADGTVHLLARAWAVRGTAP